MLCFYHGYFELHANVGEEKKTMEEKESTKCMLVRIEDRLRQIDRESKWFCLSKIHDERMQLHGRVIVRLLWGQKLYCEVTYDKICMVARALS